MNRIYVNSHGLRITMTEGEEPLPAAELHADQQLDAWARIAREIEEAEAAHERAGLPLVSRLYRR
jgi:hypothetical protein